MNEAARQVAMTAQTLSAMQRDALANWAREAPISDRHLAMESIYERARQAGRYAEVQNAMDTAFRAAVESAGGRPYGYFAVDRGPAPAWDAAARLAAETAAAEVMADLIAPEMHSLLVEPWTRLTM